MLNEILHRENCGSPPVTYCALLRLVSEDLSESDALSLLVVLAKRREACAWVTPLLPAEHRPKPALRLVGGDA